LLYFECILDFGTAVILQTNKKRDVARMGEMRNAYKFLVREYEEK
jgi:hypothetical protein